MIIKDDGMVLNTMDYGENNKILKVFTENHGIISIFVRGLKRNSDQYLTSEIFSLSSFTLYQGKSFYYIQDVEIIKSYYNFRTDIWQMTYATLVVEFIRNILFEESTETLIYQLMLKTLDYLYFDENMENIVNGFLIKFASFLGVKPIVTYCTQCQLHRNSYTGFSIDQGGLICNNCDKGISIDMMMNREKNEYLKNILYLPYNKLLQIKCADNIKFEIMDVLIQYLLNSFDVNEFNSIKFIRYMKNREGFYE